MEVPKIIIRRYPYEEPYNTSLAITATNGVFGGSIDDIYCAVEQLGEIGRALEGFPKKIGDEYRYEYGSEDSAKAYRYFLLRAYTIDFAGHCALQIVMNTNRREPDEETVRFSIKAEPASLNKLGHFLRRFEKLEHLELCWTPNETRLFEKYQT
jgi:hypothetical protein